MIALSFTVILRRERSEPRRMSGPAGGRSSFETRVPRSHG